MSAQFDAGHKAGSNQEEKGKGKGMQTTMIRNPINNTSAWLAAGLLSLALLPGLAQAAGQAPSHPGPGAPTFTLGDPAYQGTSNAQGNVSANAPAGAAANLTGMVNQPPVIGWSTPTNTVITAPANFALTVNAADPDGAIAKVDYYNGTTLIGTNSAAPYGFTWNNVAAGTYTLSAKATDNLGMTAATGALTVIANAAPAVSLTGPANDTVLTAPATFTLSSVAADSDGSIAKVDYYALDTKTNTSALIGTATAAPYTYVWSNAPAGSYTITAVATDNHGAATTSPPASAISNAPPEVGIASPADNAVAAAPGSFTLTANATDPDGAIAKVEYYNGATLIGTATAAPYTYVWSNVPAGSYTLTAKATDNHGAATTSAAITVISNAPPAISLTAPQNNGSYTAPANITLSANATDSDGAIAKVEFFNGTTLIGTATAAPYSFAWKNIPTGSYNLTAKATDNLGATATSAAIGVTVKTGVAQVYYIHTDHLDTPRQITDTAGNVVWMWDNVDPFGNNMADENPSGQGSFEFPLRFPGQYFDRETNTHYNVNRDYDPAIGAYKQFDPIGLAGGINGYAYVENNPLSYIDPLGLDKTIWWPPGSGRSITDGPKNGNWGGGKWSGGVSGGGTGNAPVLDSGDECYQRHDQCFDSGTSKASCNRKLVDELKALPDDPKKWPRPPALGTEGDSDRFRRSAIIIFGR